MITNRFSLVLNVGVLNTPFIRTRGNFIYPRTAFKNARSRRQTSSCRLDKRLQQKIQFASMNNVHRRDEIISILGARFRFLLGLVHVRNARGCDVVYLAISVAKLR